MSEQAGRSGCFKQGEPQSGSDAGTGAPPIVTGDIQVGIETHIAREVERNGGYFMVPFEGDTLKLKLVRVHVEYLASLGPRRHFACVDMASSDGEFYDIDFWLEGVAGDMRVTETTVHKLNGKPFYIWKQNPDKNWVRAPAEDASAELLGVLHGTDAFEFRYQATLPEINGEARCWIPLAGSDDWQTVTVKSINAPGKRRTLTDKIHGNRVLYLELRPDDGGAKIEIVYDVVRREKSAYPGDPEAAKAHLKPEKNVPDDEHLKAEAKEAVVGFDSDLMRGRALYDHVIDRMRYMKHGDGWGKGDALYACNALTGNCTDFHAYFIGLARSVGIPAALPSVPPSHPNGTMAARTDIIAGPSSSPREIGIRSTSVKPTNSVA